jgi:hypothetical protein
MSTPEFELIPPDDPAPPAPPWTWKSTLVCIFVSFQLFIIFFRNPLDLWWREIEGYLKKEQKETWEACLPYYRFVDRWTERYENGLGVEQGWCMFAPPIARAAPFLTTQLQFDDGETEIIPSANEQIPGQTFFRLGGWRQRKLEDKLAYMNPDDLVTARDLPLWKAYVRWRVRDWRAAHPGDPRQIVRVDLIRRRVPFPNPDPFKEPDEVESYPVGHFNADGSLQ